MTLIVETGAGVAGANTYADVVALTAYMSERGYVVDADDAAKSAAILRAMTYMEARPWKGAKVSREGSLEWPRVNVVDRNGYAVPADEVPPQVVKALCEAAYREIVTPGVLQPDQGRDNRLKSLKVDIIEMEWEPGVSAVPVVTIINDILRGLVYAGGVTKLVRG